MPDEIPSNPTPSNAPISLEPEAPIPVVTEPTAPIQAEIPTESEPIAEPPTAQMGGNEPLAEPVQVETEPIPAQPTEPEIPEAIPTTETTRAEATPVAQVQTPASVPTSTPAKIATSVVTPVIAQTFKKSIRELFTKAQLAIQNRKRKKIDRVMDLLAKRANITNNEVEKLLHISDATATRYLSALEKEGKIKQNGKTGKGVSYSKI